MIVQKIGRIVALVVLFVTSMVASVSAQSLDNRGKDFILSFLPNFSGPNVELHLTSEVATQVTIQYPVNSPTFDQTFAVTPGAITIVSLPSSAAQGWNINAPQNNAIRGFAADEFGVYMVNRSSATSDAALGLPVDTMNTEYVVTTYNEAFLSAQFVVTAAFDNTSVTITPSRDLEGGALAGQPFVITLNRGEGYMVHQAERGVNGGLAGSLVSADKPVGVTNGNGCTQVPIGTTACDTIFEVAHPVQTWANEVLAVNLPGRPGGTVYRMVASANGTTVSQNGVAIGTINRGEFLEVGPVDGTHVFSANKPIFGTQFMTGNSSPGAILGDPAMANLIPTAQFQKSYTFSTVGGNQFEQHFLTIIANNSDVGSLLFDGVAVNAAQFTGITGTSFSWAILELSEGTHTTASNNPHGITVLGVNNFDSYLYPGGASFQFINPVGDANPPLCSVTFNANPKGFVGLAIDDRQSEDVNNNQVLDAGEDLNNNGQIDRDSGIFFVELLNGATNAVLSVAPFVPGTKQVSFSVAVPDQAADANGTVRVTDGAGNVCLAELGAVDCLGVKNGKAVLDRCNVCNGDGTSCLGCKDVTLSSIQFKLDGSALEQRNLVMRAVRGLRGARNQEFAANAVAEAQSLYNQSWELVWSLPSVTKSCTNTTFCVNTATSGAKGTYQANAKRLSDLLRNVVRRRYGSNVPAFGKLLVRRSEQLLQRNKTETGKIPAQLSACS